MSLRLYCARDELGRAAIISAAPSAITTAFALKFLSKLVTAVFLLQSVRRRGRRRWWWRRRSGLARWTYRASRWRYPTDHGGWVTGNRHAASTHPTGASHSDRTRERG